MVDRAQTRIRMGLQLTKCPMENILLVKRLQGSCADIYFLRALSPFLNHTFYTESVKPPLLQSFQENYTVV
jgi:hypothetical protein